MIPQALDQVLDSWRHWAGIAQPGGPESRPQIERQLSNGPINQCWLVRSGEQRFVVRLGSDRSTALGCPWQQELEATQVAARNGLGPALQHFEPMHRVMVLDYAGESLTPAAIDAGQIASIAALTMRLHSLPTTLLNHGYLNTIERYWTLRGISLSDFDRKMQYFASQLDQEAQSHVFCHHDLSPGNLLQNNCKLQLVDWEYARVGHALFDLASLILNFRLNPYQAEELLLRYKLPPHLDKQVQAGRLPQMYDFIGYLTRLWQQAVEASGGDTEIGSPLVPSPCSERGSQ